LTNLNPTFYRLRQGSIDEELFDMIAGFNALSRIFTGAIPETSKQLNPPI
jgi:hypothetical protein